MTDAKRPTWTEINLDRLAFNFRSVKKFVGANVEYMAVVKADGYGHGAVECAKTLEHEGIDWFGVALPEEGLELRENSITKPILCLGSFWSGHEHRQFYFFLSRHDLIFRQSPTGKLQVLNCFPKADFPVLTKNFLNKESVF